MRCRLIIAVGCALAVMVAAAPGADVPATQRMKQTEGRWTYPLSNKQVEGGYLLFAPPDWDGLRPLPLVIFLHGAGHRGDDLAKLHGDELVKQIREGKVFDALVACPQVNSYWTGEQCAAFIDQLLAEKGKAYDPDRVYLTGESSGGGGAWEGAKLRADKLAALVPIATTIGDPKGAEKLVHLPTWAFHNVHDPYQVVGKSRAQVEAIRGLGGRYAFLTEYTATPGKQSNGQWPNAHRHAWETAYRDERLWEWLFRQRRGEPGRSLDPAPSTQPRGD